MLNVGDKAPAFSANDQDGNAVKLSDFKGKKLALYFYPKDDTPGCTKQACSIRDGYKALKKAGINVIGVSTDDKQSHQDFIKKYKLPFILLADTNKKVVEKYGVYGERNLYGNKFMGVKRTTFLIDEEGKIVKIFKRVKVDEHADEILKAFGA
ncbi:MAG TPA: thioredoxin-dependent thiol peroxidase [Aridibacter sp.]|nr:thioredoxin-dependent thiol peroxidase [Aridibacter sp.]